jgi:hypothetical protein
MATAARASGPKTRKAGTATVPTPAIFFSSNDTSDTASAIRLQRLLPLGIIGFRADLIAQLAWGEAR